ncbi:MAG: DUF1566 domain-containing protein [Saprospiraceae bacterium]|nr:DUF1566 domain-containing protein [Saprospiraceae bacterium]MCB9324059.1 DUF1566 domain-containing protein [Lewinellaceae bacterium]
MKKIISIAVFSLMIFSFVFSQIVPQGMNFQAVARDSKGQVLADKDITLKISLLAEGPSGKVIYSEIHDVTTSNLGLFNIIIGEGVAGIGVFEKIAWSHTSVWMDMALEEGDEFLSISTTRLLTVPYAFHAGTAGEVIGNNPTEKAITLYWKTLGNTGNNPQYHFLGNIDSKDLPFRTNNLERMRLLAGGDLQMTGNNIKNLGDPVDQQDAATRNYVDLVGLTLENLIETHTAADGDLDPTNELQKWSNLPGIPAGFADNTDNVDDADNDPTNELQKWSNLPGIPADFSDNTDNVDDADNDPTNELQNWSSLPGIPAGFLDGTDNVDDADNDPTNEIETWSTLSGIPAYLLDGDDVDDGDNDPTNELQKWSNLPGIPAGFADNTDNVDDADNDPTNEIELPTNPQNGTMAYYNGGAWQVVAPGSHGQTLTFCNGVPTWGPCNLAIGDFYAGGIIFYLDASGHHGLVAALSDQDYNGDFTGAWGCEGTYVGAGSYSIGSNNTTAILNGCGEPGIAARRCGDYSVTVDGILYDDWFLPSRQELFLMYQQKDIIGGFSNSSYWSSTEVNSNWAWIYAFDAGYAYYGNKGANYMRCRAIRAF